MQVNENQTLPYELSNIPRKSYLLSQINGKAKPHNQTVCLNEKQTETVVQMSNVLWNIPKKANQIYFH